MKEKHVAVSATVQALIGQCRIDGHKVFMPPFQIARKDYSELKAVLEAADGKWNTKEQCFVFTHDPAERLAQALEGKMFHRKQSYQEFFTPKALAVRLAELVMRHWQFRVIPDDGFCVMEPSAGKGALVSGMLTAYHYTRPLKIVAVEAQESNLRSLIFEERRVKAIHGDFLDQVLPHDGGHYHAVLMNPPFGPGVKTWVKHVNHALGFLAKDGCLVSVVPRNASVRDLTIPAGLEANITPIKGEFDGTNVRVSILTIGVAKSLVGTVLKTVIEKAAVLPPQPKLESPEKLMKLIRQDLEESIKALDELETMLKQ